jgi:hypothetical protein
MRSLGGGTASRGGGSEAKTGRGGEQRLRCYWST